jgi:ABC-2 type transport system permease protein
MAKLWAVIKREFMERVRTKWFLIGTVLGPLFLAGITILPAWAALREKGSSSVANVVVIDATGTALGERVVAAMRDSLGATGETAPALVSVAPSGVAEAERTATASVVSKARRGYVVLDSATLDGARARYAGRNASSIADVERIRDVVQRQVLAFRLQRAGLDPAQVARLTGGRFRLSSETINDRGRGGSGAGNAIAAVIMAFLLYIMIIIYGQNVLRSVLEEKTTRVAEVIVASVRPDILLAGKVLGVGAVGLVQQMLWFAGSLAVGTLVAPMLARMGGTPAPTGGAAAAAAAPGMDLGFSLSPGLVLAYLAFFLLGYLLYSSMFAAVGAMVNSEQEAQQAAFPVMMPLILSAVLIQVVMRNPESGLARFAAWFPFTAPVIMPMRMAMVTPSALEVGGVIVGLALTCVLMLWFAARVYRVGLLMYGKKPSVGELLRWVRAA